MRLGQVPVDLVRQIVCWNLAQRCVDGAVEETFEALAHAALLLGDRGGHGGRLMVARELGDAAEQLEGGELDVLVGEGVRHQLAGGVRLGAGESDEALAGDRADEVLDDRRLGIARLEAIANEPLVVLRLAQVRGEGGGDLGVARDLVSRAHLRERLLLDRMRVGEVLGELVLEVVGGHCGSPSL